MPMQAYEVVERGFQKKFWGDQKRVGAGRPHRLRYRLALLFHPKSFSSRLTAPKAALGVPQGLGAGGSWPSWQGGLVGRFSMFLGAGRTRLDLFQRPGAPGRAARALRGRSK